jgi:hypothetical protein
VLSTIAWDGGGDGVTLTDRFNWQGNSLPKIYDTAVISVPGEAALKHNSGTFAVCKLILDEQLTVDGGTVCVGEAAFINGTLTLESGKLTGPGDYKVFGKLKWTGGDILSGGDLITKPGGKLVLDGIEALELGRDLYNGGDAIWLSGDLVLDCDDDGCSHYNGCGHSDDSIIVHNLEGGLFKVIAGAKLQGDTNDRFKNEGDLVRDGEGMAVFLVRSDNYAALNVVAGTLQLHEGGENSGPRHVAEGGILHYVKNFQHLAGSTLTGGGITIWQGGTHTIAADWTIASFVHVTNTTVTGPGTLFIDGPLTWNHGLMDGDGDLVINPSGKISLMTPGAHRLSRDIVNNGTLIWNNGTLDFQGATITNMADRFFFIQSNATATASAGENGIVNLGEMRKQLPTIMDLSAVRLDNQGFLNVRNGSLTLGAANVAQIEGATLAGGRWSVFGTASLSVPGAMVDTIGAGASVSRIGLFANLTLISSLVRNDGSIMIQGGGAFIVDAAEFVNSGTLTIRRGTTLRVNGNYVQTPTGTLDLFATSNQMLYSGRLVSFQHASLAGTVSFTFALYTPVPGDRYVFLAADSLSGEFESLVLNGVSESAGVLIYGTNTVELRFE